MHPPLKVWFVAKKIKQAIMYSKSKLKKKCVNVFISEDTYVAKNWALMHLKKKPSDEVIRDENLHCYIKTPRLKN